jgi:hypothetical protein
MDDLNEQDELGHFVPVGTLALLALYLVMIVALWVSVYLILLSRGATL